MLPAILRPSGYDPQETEYEKERRLFADMQKAAERQSRAAGQTGPNARRLPWPLRPLVAWLRRG